MTKDYLPERIVDAGYISWLFGSSCAGINSWNVQKFHYMKDLMVLDGCRSFRKEFWDEYKANRQDVSPEQLEKREMVNAWREELLDSWFMWTVRVAGFEADDIVSALHLYGQGDLEVIGVDKDYLQLPWGLHMSTLGGDRVTMKGFFSKQPKTVQPYLMHTTDVLFTLTLLGDRVDNIPRLVPPYHLEEFCTIMEPDSVSEKIDRALDFYGEKFTRNVYLAILPGPWVYDPTPTPEEVLQHLVKDTYYSQKLSPDISAKVFGSYYAKYPLEGKM